MLPLPEGILNDPAGPEVCVGKFAVVGKGRIWPTGDGFLRSAVPSEKNDFNEFTLIYYQKTRTWGFNHQHMGICKMLI